MRQVKAILAVRLMGLGVVEAAHADGYLVVRALRLDAIDACREVADEVERDFGWVVGVQY